jgi:hypothetical protein
MNRNRIVISLLGILLVALLAMLNVRPAAAQEPVEMQFDGTLASVDPLAASFVVELEDASLVTVLAPDGFDMTTLVAGEQVAVRGTQNEDGSVSALWIGVQAALTGSLVSVDALAGSFTIALADAGTLVVLAPAGYDLTPLVADANVEILGLWNEDGSLNALTIRVLVDLAGNVAAMDPLADSFTLETPEGIQWLVIPPDGFDWTSIHTGDPVQVTGMLNVDGSVAAVTILAQSSEDGEATNDGFYCTQSEKQHPLGAFLAATYQVDYASLQSWFCQGYGWGQIVLALQTGANNDLDPSVLLAKRGEGEGWGQIWQEVGGKGKPGPDDDEETVPDDEAAGESGPDRPGNSNKPEDHPGNPHGDDEPEVEATRVHGNPHGSSHGNPQGNPHKP